MNKSFCTTNTKEIIIKLAIYNDSILDFLLYFIIKRKMEEKKNYCLKYKQRLTH